MGDAAMRLQHQQNSHETHHHCEAAIRAYMLSQHQRGENDGEDRRHEAERRHIGQLKTLHGGEIQDHRSDARDGADDMPARPRRPDHIRGADGEGRENEKRDKRKEATKENHLADGDVPRELDDRVHQREKECGCELQSDATISPMDDAYSHPRRLNQR